MFLGGTFPDQCHLNRLVDILIVLVGGDTHMIAGLEVANFRGTAGSIHKFGRTRSANGSDRLVFRLDHDSFVSDVA